MTLKNFLSVDLIEILEAGFRPTEGVKTIIELAPEHLFKETGLNPDTMAHRFRKRMTKLVKTKIKDCTWDYILVEITNVFG
jgi:hypothetical protein